MTTRRNHREDKVVRQIRELLIGEYLAKHPQARIDVKRYSSLSVRLRVIDPDFAGLSPVDRDDAIWDLLDTLPGEVRDEVALLLLLTPEETKSSLLNREFDQPTPSILK